MLAGKVAALDQKRTTVRGTDKLADLPTQFSASEDRGSASHSLDQTAMRALQISAHDKKTVTAVASMAGQAFLSLLAR